MTPSHWARIALQVVILSLVDVSWRKDEQLLYDVLCKSNLLDGLKTLAADPPVAFGGDSGCGEGSLQWAGAK